MELTKEQFDTSLAVDPDNYNGSRNYRNTPIEAYNCGGFALSVYDWVCPYVYEEDYNSPGISKEYYTESEREYIMDMLFDEGYLEEEIEEYILQKDVEFLLRKYQFLTETTLEDCAQDEDLIAYRIFVKTSGEYVEDTDFHFKIRINGIWFEKMGANYVTVCDLKPNEPWDVGNLLNYKSRIVYFKTKRKKI